ncbi:MAG: GNAT family N-acetyltransferase [Patescibacteria group bacterium]
MKELLAGKVENQPHFEFEDNLSENLKKIEAITEFYNENFPKSKNSVDFKVRKYANRELQPIVLTISESGKIVGLLESWLVEDDLQTRILVTLAVDEKYRGKGLAKKLLSKAFQATSKEDDFTWVLHFRDSKKQQLASFYAAAGFGDLVDVGNYKNGETKWEMTRKQINKKD